MDRNQFLNDIWKSYPEMPINSRVAGRYIRHEVLENRHIKIYLVRNGKTIEEMLPSECPLLRFLVPGDIVSVLENSELILLAPQLNQLPEIKFNEAILRSWDQFLQEIRNFFKDQDFFELQTPLLVTCPGTEPSLDVFATELVVGSRKEKLYLPTSPEIHLKKALALGADRIFEITKCFRNGEITERHQPEFTMIEWYRAYNNLEAIKKDVVALVKHLSEKLNCPGPQKIHFYSVAQLFEKYCGFNFTPQTTKEELKKLAELLGVDVHSAESIDDFFFLIFMEKIESQFGGDELIFVEKYPPYQAALARLTPDGWGDRFEVYWKGLELANAFHELNDPKIQRLRSEEDLVKKIESRKESISLDEDFFRCLGAGLPPSGGIALGLERLFMALTNVQNIAGVQLFSKS